MKIASLSATLALSAWLLSSSVQATAQTPVPPPIEQSVADCSRPVFASDQLVCSDPELRDLDGQLAQVLRQNTALPDNDFVENDSQWFKRRGRCAFETEHRSCLMGAYQDRLSIISGAAMTPVRTLAAKCKSLGRVSLGVLQTGHMSLRAIKTTALIAVASPVTGQSPWKPVLTTTERGRVFEFKRHVGPNFSCRVNR